MGTYYISYKCWKFFDDILFAYTPKLLINFNNKHKYMQSRSFTMYRIRFYRRTVLCEKCIFPCQENIYAHTIMINYLFLVHMKKNRATYNKIRTAYKKCPVASEFMQWAQILTFTHVAKECRHYKLLLYCQRTFIIIFYKNCKMRQCFLRSLNFFFVLLKYVSVKVNA